MFRQEQIPYQEESYLLHLGDKVVIYTDGLSEWMNLENELFSMREVADFLWNHRHLNLESMLGSLLEQARHFSQGNPCNDDLTILAFQFLG